jgi:hypothetical protein
MANTDIESSDLPDGFDDGFLGSARPKLVPRFHTQQQYLEKFPEQRGRLQSGSYLSDEESIRKAEADEPWIVAGSSVKEPVRRVVSDKGPELQLLVSSSWFKEELESPRSTLKKEMDSSDPVTGEPYFSHEFGKNL